MFVDQQNLISCVKYILVFLSYETEVGMEVSICMNKSSGCFFFFAKWEFSLNDNRNTREISKPRLFKKSWEIFRELQNRGETQRDQLS